MNLEKKIFLTEREGLNENSKSPGGSEADIMYIMHSLRGEAIPVWVIHVYGYAPSPKGIDHMRSVINANTGYRVTSGNFPMPTIEDLKKLRSADSTGDSD